MVNEIQTVNCKFLRRAHWGVPSLCLICLLSFTLNLLIFFHSLYSVSLPSLSLLYSIWRPLRGGQTWWWSMPRPSCVSTRPTWTRLLKYSHPTAGTVSPSSSCSMTSWESTVSEKLLKENTVYSLHGDWSSWACLAVGSAGPVEGRSVKKWPDTSDVGLMKGKVDGKSDWPLTWIWLLGSFTDYVYLTQTANLPTVHTLAVSCSKHAR